MLCSLVLIDLKLLPALPMGVMTYVCHMTNGHMTSVLLGGVYIYLDEAVFVAGGIFYVVD